MAFEFEKRMFHQQQQRFSIHPTLKKWDETLYFQQLVQQAFAFWLD